MNALDSPLALSYGFLTAVNKMLAAWAAAFGFWRMGHSSPPRPDHRGRTKDAATTSSAPPLLEMEMADEPAKVAPTRGGTDFITALETTENSTRGKFFLYYSDDDSREGGADGDDDDGVAATAGSKKFRRWSDVDWERKMEIRMGDMGWYSGQDLTALNGSVVRLWDVCSPVYATA
ncbi:hypothetical protein F511_34073 [Dorcoceras hygrometricum]|uniref:Uncharacterized protein n=1 Tax=Dorcoceras hygrometricum TaxID=472368 RepID=A0A2Z7A9A1_9LAMI|nr:hypothetical protein F511_34073 [Dorcoceras hygrometricum]